MRRHFIFLLLLLPLYLGCRQSHDTSQKVPRPRKGYEVKIEIPSAWIDKVRKFSYKPTDTSVLKEFEQIIKPETLTNPHIVHVAKDYGKVFTPIFADLDGEPGEELICLLGWDVTCPYLCAFKQTDGIWYLIYLEDIDTFYGAPSLSVANNFSKNKTFYFDHVYNHGSGVYGEGYRFYKLINNKVYHCLDLTSEDFGYAGGAGLSHSIKASFQFSGDYKDQLFVKYAYNFFPGINEGGNNCSWCANEDIPLVKGEGGVSYVWDAKYSVYKLDIQNFKSTDQDLTAARVNSLEHAWNDSLFVAAFKDRIDDKLKTGTPQQRKILTDFMDYFKNEKR